MLLRFSGLLLVTGALLWLLLARDPGRWETDLALARESAAQSEAPLLAQLYREDLPLWKRMLEETWRDEEVARRLEGYVLARVDVGTQPELFRELTGGAGSLALCVVDPASEATWAILPGYRTAGEVERFLEWANAHADAHREHGRRVEQSPAGSSSRVEALLSMAELLLEGGAHAAARARLDELVGEAGAAEDDALSDRAWERLARLAARSGQIEEGWRALAEVESVSELVALRVKLTRALLLREEGRLGEASRLLAEVPQETGAQSSPGGAVDPFAAEEQERWYLQAELAHETGDDEAAERFLDLLIERYPRSLWWGAARRLRQHLSQPAPDHPHRRP